MLQARAGSTKESTLLEGLSDAALNSVLARTPEELALFSQMDAAVRTPKISEQPPPNRSSAAPLSVQPRATDPAKRLPPANPSSGNKPSHKGGPVRVATTKPAPAGALAVKEASAKVSIPEGGSGTPSGDGLRNRMGRVVPGTPSPEAGGRLASHEEVRAMVEAAEAAAAPAEVEEDCGRGKRRRTVGTYKEPGMKV